MKKALIVLSLLWCLGCGVIGAFVALAVAMHWIG